jgi:hypothetical protein
MTRLSSDNNDVAEQPHFPYVLLASFDFVSGVQRLNSSDRDYIHDSNTYTGLGHMCSISDVEETGDGSPNALTFQLSGVDTSLTTISLAEKYHRRDVALYLGFLDDAGELVDTPYTLWEGYMDTMSIVTDHNISNIVLVAENRFVMWDRATDWQYTDAHQRLFDPTDAFFNQVNSLMNKVIKWKDFKAAQAEYAAGGPVRTDGRIWLKPRRR